MKQFDSFSSAIRFGATLKPQGFGCMDDREIEDRQTSCALEAAIEALNLDISWADEEAIYGIYPYMRTVVKSPISEYDETLFALCWKLNDDGWTRERIADWLQGIEDKLFGYETITGEIQWESQPLTKQRDRAALDSSAPSSSPSTNSSALTAAR